MAAEIVQWSICELAYHCSISKYVRDIITKDLFIDWIALSFDTVFECEPLRRKRMQNNIEGPLTKSQFIKNSIFWYKTSCYNYYWLL